MGALSETLNTLTGEHARDRVEPDYEEDMDGNGIISEELEVSDDERAWNGSEPDNDLDDFAFVDPCYEEDMDDDGPAEPGVTPARTHRRMHINSARGRRLLLEGALPEWAVVVGDLHFEGDESPKFPPNVRVTGSLSLHNCRNVTELGDGLAVDHNAEFVGTPLSRLPSQFSLMGVLTMINTNVKEVPADLDAQGGVVVDKDASPSLQELASKEVAKRRMSDWDRYVGKKAAAVEVLSGTGDQQ